MRIKFIEKLRFKLSGRGVPVLKVEDVDSLGTVKTLHFLGTVKKRANSLVSTWDQKGWEIDRAYPMIRYIDERGIESQIYVVSESGRTCGLFTQPSAFPNREDIIGKASTMDDVSESMDLGKSVKNLVIGAAIGIFVGWLFVAPAFQVALS